MNREILFRGKRVDNDEWATGYLVRGEHYIYETEITAIYPPDTIFYPNTETTGYDRVFPETIGQYTGLTDKNGKKIFEGDIVKFSHPAFNKSRIGVIRYKMNETGFVLRYKGDYSWIAYTNEFYEVIGNVYDNPELLEVGND